MEAKEFEIIFITLVSIILTIDLIFSLEGFLIPLVLSVIVSYIVFVKSQSIYYAFTIFLAVTVVLYIYRVSKTAIKLKDASIKGYLNLNMLFVPIFEKMQPSGKLYFKLSGQRGYVIKKLRDNLYIVRFNIGAFGKTKFFCYSDESLEWGNQVKLKELKDGKIYVEKVS